MHSSASEAEQAQETVLPIDSGWNCVHQIAGELKRPERQSVTIRWHQCLTQCALHDAILPGDACFSLHLRIVCRSC